MLKRSSSDSDILSSSQQHQPKKQMCNNPTTSFSEPSHKDNVADSDKDNIRVYFNDEEIFLIPFTILDQEEVGSLLPICVDDSCLDEITQKVYALCISDKPDAKGFKHDLSIQYLGNHIKANYCMGGNVLYTKSIFNFTKANMRSFLKLVVIKSQSKPAYYRKPSNRLSINFCFVHLNFDALEKCNFAEHNPKLVNTNKITHYYQGGVEYGQFAVMELSQMMVEPTNPKIKGFSFAVDKDDQNFNGQLMESIEKDVLMHFDQKIKLVGDGNGTSNAHLNFGKDSYSSNFFNVVYMNIAGNIRNCATRLQWNNTTLKKQDIQKKQDVLDSVVNTSDPKAFFHRFREIYSDVQLGGVNSAFVTPHLLQETAEKINKQLGSNEIIYGKREAYAKEFLNWVVEKNIEVYCERKMGNMETQLVNTLFTIKRSIEDVSSLELALENKKGEERIIAEKKIQDNIKSNNNEFKAVAQEIGFYILRQKMNRLKFLVYLKLKLRTYVEHLEDINNPLDATLTAHVDLKDVTMLEFDIKD